MMNASEVDGPGGKYHWAYVGDVGGTRMVWVKFDTIAAAKKAIRHTLRIPALRNATPVLHPAGASSGHYSFG